MGTVIDAHFTDEETENPSNWPKDTQLGSDTGRNAIQTDWLQSPFS